MDSDTFQLFVTRFEAYIDRIQQDTVDYDALVDTVVSRLNVTFNNIQPIDFENISPVIEPIRSGGEHLNFFNGTLQVPEIDREHNIQTQEVRGLGDLDDSLETSGIPGIVRTPLLTRTRPQARPGVSRPKNIRGSRTVSKTTGKTSPKRESKKSARAVKKDKPNTRKPISNKGIRQARDAKYRGRAKNNEWKRARSSRSMPVELKNQMVKQFPDRFKLENDGKLIEKLPNGKTVVVTESMVKDILINNPPPMHSKTLKSFTKAMGVVGVAFTAYDLYLLYNIFSDGSLSQNDKIEQSGPIIGQMLGGFGGAVAGAMAGSAVLPGWGTFFGSVGGGVAGVFAGDALGEVVAEYIVGDEPPEHSSGKPWSKLSDEEIQQWVADTSIEKSKTNTSDTQTPLPTKNKTPEYIPEPIQTEILLQSVQEPLQGVSNTNNKRSEKIQKINNMIDEYTLQKREQNKAANQLLEEIRAVGR